MSVLERVGKGLVSFGMGVPQIELDRQELANDRLAAGTQATNTVNEINQLKLAQAQQAPDREAQERDRRRRAIMGDFNAQMEMIANDPDTGMQTLEAMGIRDESQLQGLANRALRLQAVPAELRPQVMEQIRTENPGVDLSHTESILELPPEHQDAALQAAQQLVANSSGRMNNKPSAVQEFEFYESLGDPKNPDKETEAQKRYRQVKRATGRITDVAGVPTIVDTGSGDQEQLSTQAEELDALRAQTAATTEAGGGGLNLTEGQKKVDAAFAPDFVAWQAQGGFADVQKNVSQLGDVQKRLNAGEKLTGTLIGNQPRAILATTNPEALDALEQVEEVIQRNLRLILGAQFTEKEGVRLIARAYNPRLEPELNAKRLARLTKSLTAAAKAKNEAAKYFTLNGTLAGWGGTMPSISGIENELDNAETPQERLQRLRAEVEELESAD